MSARTVEDYLRLPYTLEVTQDTNAADPGWVARVVELPGCLTQADSFEALGPMIRDAMRGWIEIGLEDGQSIPEPRPAETYSGKFVARVPRSLHRQLAEAAERALGLTRDDWMGDLQLDTLPAYQLGFPWSAPACRMAALLEEWAGTT